MRNGGKVVAFVAGYLVGWLVILAYLCWRTA